MAFKDWLSFNRPNDIANKIYQATFEFLGGQQASYDKDNKTYLEKGYLDNPDIYSVVTQRYKKLQQIPFLIKDVEDENRLKDFKNFEHATKGNFTPIQKLKRDRLIKSAFKDEEKRIPLDKPNPMQSWGELIALYEMYMAITGNCFFYKVAIEGGNNDGKPTQLWVLPAHLMSIVLKENANLLSGDESPIDYYKLIEGNTFIEFDEKEVIHVKYANPNFDLQGSHLYGLSPLRALLPIMEASNEMLNQNVKTALNAGVFGFITGKDKVFTSEQGTALKQQLVEMDKNAGRLSRIAAGSVPVEFTKLSLSTNELQPFEFLKYNQKIICNVLGWSDKLLNNDEGGSYNNLKTYLKSVVTNTIIPDAKLLEEALTHGFVRHFKGYENAVWQFDYVELPEMQEDIKEMNEWLSIAPVTMNEWRTAINYESLEEEGMDIVWISQGKKRIDEVGVTINDINNSYNE